MLVSFALLLRVIVKQHDNALFVAGDCEST